MENSRFWVFILRVVLLLCAFCVLLGPENFAVADDDVAFTTIDDGDDISGSAGVAADLPGGGGGDGGGGGRSQLCDADLSSFLPPPYGNLSGMACSPIWNTFILRYSQREDHVTTIILSAVYATGWVGMGFSKDGMMVGSSAMVGWFNRKGHARIKQYYLQGSRTSQVIPDKGELQLTNIPATVVLHGAMIYLAFQVKFEHHPSQQPIILAFGSTYPNHYRLSSHDDKTTILYDFSAGSASAMNVDYGRKKRDHGILGMIGWGLILPIGAIVARYLKHKDPLWYYLHAVIQFVGFMIGLAGVILGTQLYNGLHVNLPTHRGIGIFVLVLSILQILAFFLRPNKDAKIRKYWNWYHHWFGRTALFFGALNIVLGIQIGSAGNDWKIGYGFLLGTILVAVIVLEALFWMRGSDSSETTTLPSAFQMNPVK